MIRRLLNLFKKKPKPSLQPIASKIVIATHTVHGANSTIYAGDIFTIEKVKDDGFIYIKKVGALIPLSDAYDFANFIYVSNEIEAILKLVGEEVLLASQSWPPFNSAHEGFSILMEEVEELKVHVFTNQKKRALADMRKEAIQVAAMAVRFIHDVTDEVNGRK